MLYDNLQERDGLGSEKDVQEGGDVCTLMADSHCCKTETKTTRQSDYTPTTTAKTRKRCQGEGEPKLELIISFFKVRTPINSSLSLLFTAMLQLFTLCVILKL